MRAAAESELDPWMLHAHLRASGAGVSLRVQWADLVAERAPQLGAYAEASTKRPYDAAWLVAISKAGAALENNEAAEALRVLEAAAIRRDSKTIVAAAAALLEAQAHWGLAALEACVRSALAAGRGASAIGWRDAARRAWAIGLRAAQAAGLYDDARECALGKIDMGEAAGDIKVVADAYQDVAGIDLLRGDLSGALRYFDEALALHESLGSAGAIVDALSLRSVVYAQMGDYRRALASVRAVEGRLGDFATPGRLSDFLTNAAAVYQGVGEIDKAETLLARSLAVAVEAEEVIPEAMARGNMGMVHQSAARWDEAISAYQGALDIAEKEGHGFLIAVAQLNIAEALRQRADARLVASRSASGPKREALLLRVREDCDRGLKLVGAGYRVMKPVGAAGVLASMAETRCRLLLARGDTEDLEGHFEDAIAEARRLHKWNTQMAASLGLVRLRATTHDWKGAVRTARDVADELAGGYAGLTDMDLARARSGHADVIDWGVRAAHEADRTEDLHYLLERGRAGALLRGLGGRGAVLRATVPQELLRRLAKRTRSKARALADLNLAYRRRHVPRQREKRKAYESVRAAELSVRMEIEREELRSLRSLVPPRIEDLRAVRRALRAMDASGTPTTYLAFSLQARDAWCLVVREGGARVVRYDTVRVGKIHDALRAVRDDGMGEFSPGTLARLRENLIAPLALPSGRLRLLIAPDRELAYVPYRALLADEVDIALVPSATLMLALASRGRRRGSFTIALGDPAYGRVPDREVLHRRGGYRLGRLPETGIEVRAITKGKHDVRLLREDATEDGLVAALQSRGPTWRWSVVLLACHGLIDVEWPALCALAVTPSKAEDGLLTTSEVFRLPLRADLVVMSACQTGRGRYVRGEGIMGLVRAFMHAGAPRIVASLWKVEDRASSALMQAFHGYYMSGMPTAEALRRAQIKVRDTIVKSKDANGKTVMTRPWEDPSYWAAWVLWGLPD